MLRINVFTGSEGAKKYYETALKAGDYYLSNDKDEPLEIVGNWGGKFAKELGLTGQVTEADFLKLLKNVDPRTGQDLTQRTKSGRRVGYDFNFHVPKSFSVMQLVTGDARLMDAFRDSVRETMEQMEGQMQARVRVDNQSHDRETGKMAWAEFIHFTSRPVDGIPDPHTHAHCFVINATPDDVEGKIKAGQFGQIIKNADLSQAVFHNTLMRKTRGLGYKVRLKKDGKGWEIEGVGDWVIDAFSRRRNQVMAEAQRLGITNDKDRDGLTATTREDKQKNLSKKDLLKIWHQRLGELGIEFLEQTAEQAELNEGKDRPGILTPEDYLKIALRDGLERASNISHKNLLKNALIHSRGDFNKADFDRELERGLDGMIAVDLPRGKYYTTPQVVHEESQILGIINGGLGKYAPLNYNTNKLEKMELGDEQKEAVKHVMNSSDAVVGIRGGAGTGKTVTLSAIKEFLNKAGKEVYAFAPSAQASRGVLRTDGFEDAETVARLLSSEDIQEKIRGQFVLIDEAGLLSSPDMLKALQIAREQGARVITSGDTRQHASVERGDAQRIAETMSGLKQTELKQTRRQIDEGYKKAVEEIRDGATDKGLDSLNDKGWVKEIEDQDQRYKELASNYLRMTGEGEDVLVVSPTHGEGSRITEALRSQLQKAGRLGEENQTKEILQSQKLTEGQKRPHLLEDGDILKFYQKAKLPLVPKSYSDFHSPKSLEVEAGREYQIFRFDGVSKIIDRRTDETIGTIDNFQDWNTRLYDVYTQKQIPVSTGEKIRITENSKDQEKKELMNGQSLIVQNLNQDGSLTVQDKTGQTYTLPKDYKSYTPDYYTTSHSSQGKTADRVLLAQSMQSMHASDQKQLYVSASRGRKSITIYTDSFEDLKDNTRQTNDRLSALELIREGLKHVRTSKAQQAKTKTPAKQQGQSKQSKTQAKKTQSITTTKPTQTPTQKAQAYIKAQQKLRDLQNHDTTTPTLEQRQALIDRDRANLARLKNKITPEKPKPTPQIQQPEPKPQPQAKKLVQSPTPTPEEKKEAELVEIWEQITDDLGIPSRQASQPAKTQSNPAPQTQGQTQSNDDEDEELVEIWEQITDDLGIPARSQEQGQEQTIDIDLFDY